MWTPCDDPIDEYNEKTGKMVWQQFFRGGVLVYQNTGNCCGLGVDDDNYDYDEEQ